MAQDMNRVFAKFQARQADNPGQLAACTAETMIADLRDEAFYGTCEAGDLSCFRAVGSTLASICLTLDLFSCGGGTPQSAEQIADTRECQQDLRSFADAAYQAIHAELPAPRDIGKIEALGFTEERRITQELDDVNVQAWPADCGPFPAETLATSDIGCANMFSAERLKLVSSIASVLHGAADAF